MLRILAQIDSQAYNRTALSHIENIFARLWVKNKTNNPVSRFTAPLRMCINILRELCCVSILTSLRCTLHCLRAFFAHILKRLLYFSLHYFRRWNQSGNGILMELQAPSLRF